MITQISLYIQRALLFSSNYRLSRPPLNLVTAKIISIRLITLTPTFKMPAKDKYTDPKLREEVKKDIQGGDKGGAPGQWSARKVCYIQCPVSFFDCLTFS